MNIIALDIETIPSQEPWVKEHVTKELSAPANYKDADKIAAYIAEKQDEAYRKTSFDGAYNHIICISASIESGEPATFYAEKVDQEATVIQSFYDWLNDQELFWNSGKQQAVGSCFVGHNVIGFDLKILKQRSVILGIKPPSFIPFNTKPWETNLVFDTMTQWDSDRQKSIGLDKLCKAMNIPGKDGMDGSMVYDAWLNGEHDKIKEYCADDVRRVRAVHRKMCFLEG
jgi:3'-5' exonuclease